MSYATTADRDRLGIKPAALTSLASATVQAALDAASAVADGYLANACTLPLTAWGDDLRLCVIQIADWNLLCNRGFDPQRGGDEALRLRHEDAMRWLRDVANGRVTLSGAVDQTPAEMEGGTYLVSNPRRGWARR